MHEPANLHGPTRRNREAAPSLVRPNDDKGIIKVVMTGNASEGPRVAEHARNKPGAKISPNAFVILPIHSRWSLFATCG